jgi:hypothetical protein
MREGVCSCRGGCANKRWRSASILVAVRGEQTPVVVLAPTALLAGLVARLVVERR